MQFKSLDKSTEIQTFLKEAPGLLAIDTETTGLNARKDKLLTVQVAYEDKGICFDAEFAPLLLQIPKDYVLIFHNAKFDLAFLHRSGVDLTGWKRQDTCLLHHLVDENASHSLDSIIQERYKDDYKEIFWSKYSEFSEAPIMERIEYSCKDALYTYKIYTEIQGGKFGDTPSPHLVSHCYRLADALYSTQCEGVSLDLDYVTELGVSLKSKIETLLPKMLGVVEAEAEEVELELYLEELAKRKTPKGKARVERPKFNFESNKQLVSLLYNKLRLPVQKNEKTKNVTTDNAALEVLKDEHPLIPLLLDFRETNKIYNTYIEGILERAEDARIYPEFNVNGTTTGRISHSNPNLGNMPKSGGIRQMFVADKGRLIVSADFGQLEVALAAHFSQDKNLLKIVLEGASQHDITAQALGIKRQLAKTVNFAMQYRCSHFKIAKTLDVSEREAIAIWNKYWETYSGLKKLMDECDYKVDNGIPIVSPFGRKRHFPVQKRQPWDKAYRQAFNALIQGTGGDITSRAFYKVNDMLRMMRLGRGLWTVHDEILIEVDERHVSAGKQLLKSNMIGVGEELDLTVPLVVECSEGGRQWLDK